MALIVNEYSPDDIIWRDYPSPSITLQGKHTFASYQSSSIWRQNNNANSAINSVQEEVLHEQEKLKEEQCNIQKRSERLLSIMQQFKGMWRHCLYGNWKEGRGGRVFFLFSIALLQCQSVRAHGPLSLHGPLQKCIRGEYIYIITI